MEGNQGNSHLPVFLYTLSWNESVSLYKQNKIIQCMLSNQFAPFLYVPSEIEIKAILDGLFSCKSS